MINTKTVNGRRQVRYQSLDDLRGDAERLAGDQNVTTLGNWSQGQIYEHLARALDTSIDGSDMSFPAPARWMMSLLMKKKFLYKEIPAGFKVSGKVVPDETSVEQGLDSLRQAIDRQQSESSRVMHPGFGRLTNEEWEAFHLRHAEMHMSFLVEG